MAVGELRVSHPLVSGVLPAWAVEWGQDRRGVWAAFEIRGVVHRLRWIPPGTFQMGSPESELERYGVEIQHQVTLTPGFWLGETACTQELWSAVMGENPSKFPGDQNPVENVSWDDCQRFLEAASSLVPGLELRLPTEAEWEYACRAGTTTPFSFGEQITPDLVNYNGNFPYAGGLKGKYCEQTVPVGSLPPNPWGMHEMHGNVWEWCEDWFGDYPSNSEVNPTGPKTGAARVLRGGSWIYDARFVRSACRGRDEPGERGSYCGFRCARGQDEPAQAGERGRPRGALRGAERAERRDAEAGRAGRS